jgi:hypothetical protein
MLVLLDRLLDVLYVLKFFVSFMSFISSSHHVPSKVSNLALLSSNVLLRNPYPSMHFRYDRAPA